MAIDKTEFAVYIKAFNFRSLFIEGLGWDNDKSSQTVAIDDKPYAIQSVAEKSGFRILVCTAPAGEVIPPLNIRKQIETKVSKLFHEHILIFVDDKKEEQRWMSTIRLVDKKPMEIAWYSHQNPELLYQRVSGLGFELDQEGNITIVDVTKLVAANFSQNNEKVTKKFYERFKQEHTAFLEFITGIDDVVKREWYASLMLNRLMFCYFIQKRGFLDNGDLHYLKNKLKACQEKKGKNKFYSFYRNFLLVLFQQGLGAPHHSVEVIKEIGKIPYLNGGLFDEHQIEKTYTKIIIPDEAFERIFEFFEKYHWHLDTRIEADGENINPDVIGYIFEKYINDRAAMGAYYTKEDITQYISANTIIPWLLEKVKSILPEVFSEGGGFWQYLQDSGDKYIYDAVKQGIPEKAKSRTGSIGDIEIPDNIRIGLNKAEANLLERRKDWNMPTPIEFALPTEIWRETIARWERYFEVKHKIEKGEIHEINDLITYNLNIRELIGDYLAQTGYYKFVYEFYFKGLKQITILDPTCGSGAFLFAAMNILEPLYDVCIARMEDFLRNGVKNRDFLYEIDDIKNPSHPNRQYYIYKNIILHNLYGVDLMNEAVEIAKLRLFLKLVAQVEPNPRAANYGLEPLPDIDFNIRSGNTLVGFATKKQLFDTINEYEGNLICQEKMDELESACAGVAAVYEHFQKHQLIASDTKHGEIKEELENKLRGLESTLDRYLARTYGINPDASKQKDGKKEFEAWKKSHQPFHWFAEFYRIIEKHGGFDVVIGNPPYVEYAKVKRVYAIKNYETESCGNLYAYTIERCKSLISKYSFMGMIVQNSIVCTERMHGVQNLLINNFSLYLSTYDDRPSKLFEGTNTVKCAIFLAIPKNSNHFTVFTSKYSKWNNVSRQDLFMLINYHSLKNDLIFKGHLSKYTNRLHENILLKIYKQSALSRELKSNGRTIYCHRIVRYFIKAIDFIPYFYNEKEGQKKSDDYKEYFAQDITQRSIIISLLNSSLFYVNWLSLYDGYHCGRDCVENFPFSFDIDKMLEQKLVSFGKNISEDYKRNAFRRETVYKNTGTVIYDELYPKLSKSIIDEIDKVLAKHYGFTEEELDFIINYDIKYRMGGELEGEE